MRVARAMGDVQEVRKKERVRVVERKEGTDVGSKVMHSLTLLR